MAENRHHSAPLDVVIPTLNAAGHLDAALASLRAGAAAGLVRRAIVVDGGSADATREIAARYGARVITTEPGRGHQLRVGGAATSAPWLLFLHADTRLSPGWADEVAAFIGQADARAPRAAVFRLRMDDDRRAARVLERLVRWRTRALGLPYGDQGLLIARRFYEALGGFAELALMEDVDLVRRLGRGRLVMLRSEALTSAERYRRSGYLRRSLTNLAILGLYFCGVAPARLQGLYEGPARATKRR